MTASLGIAAIKYIIILLYVACGLVPVPRNEPILTITSKFVVATMAGLMILSLPMTGFAGVEIAARPTGLPTEETPKGQPDDLVLRAQKALTQVSFQAKAAVIFAHAGNTEQATGILNTTESFARKKIDAGGLGVALRHIAKTFAETEQLAQALNILSDVSDNSNPTPVLIAAATKQALAGDAAAALAAANTIEAVRFRTVVLGQIALTKAENGDKDAADVTLKLALAAIEKIKFSYARSYAVSRVSLAMAGIGKLPDAGARADGLFFNAVAAARKIDDNRLRAHTLWTIAAEQIRAGDDPGPQKTKTYANQATGDIKSTLSRVWMFSEIATGHAAEGEEIAAWAAFDHGLTVARSIDNSWGRARAFGRLAATLIKLVDPGDTAGAKSR